MIQHHTLKIKIAIEKIQKKLFGASMQEREHIQNEESTEPQFWKATDTTWLAADGS